MSIGPGPSARPRTRPRRGSVAWWVIVSLLCLWIVEIALLVTLARGIGVWPTVALLVAETVLGAWLVKREWRRAADSLRGAVGAGRTPAAGLTDRVLVLVGGLLLLVPGLLTDLLGLVAIAPFTRPLARAALAKVIARRVRTVVGPAGATTLLGSFGPGGAPPGFGQAPWPGAGAGTRPPHGSSAPHAGATSATRGGEDDVLEGEIL